MSGILFASNASAAIDDSAQVRAIKDEKLEMSLSSNNINVVLDDDSLKTKNLTISASTNNPNGYTITLGPKNDYTELRNNDAARTENVTIPTLTEDKTYKEFNTTGWGYDVAGYFTGLKPESEGIFKTKEEGAREHILTLGVRAIGNDIIAGTYENEILVSAVGNYVNDEDNFRYVVCEPLANAIEDDGSSTTFVAQCLQDINDEVIDSMETGKEYWLYDSRDGKPYSILKIYNNQVWMTKNLDLILDENMTLTDISTDLNTKEEWTPNHSTKNRLDRDFNVLIDTFNPGEFYYSEDASSGSDLSCREAYNHEGCEYHVTPDGIEQYKVGTYYTYSAAIAENGEPSFDLYQSAIRENSICPRGWKLPTSGDYVAFSKVADSAHGESDISAEPYYVTDVGVIREGKIDDLNTTTYYGDTAYWTSSYSYTLQEGKYNNDTHQYDEDYYAKKVQIFDGYNRGANNDPITTLVVGGDGYYGLNILTPIRCVAR